MSAHNVTVRVRGELACFTRPESKTERVSYPIMTPSAARGVLEAIYWHPEFTWRVEEIRVLSPNEGAGPKTYGILRNEVNSKMSLSATELFVDDDRTQRYALCLRNVDYVIAAEPVPKPDTDPAPKHRDIFNRRVRRGQCFHRPYLGTREFAADFETAEGAPEPTDWSEDLGLMLWDLDFARPKPPFPPLFFEAKVDGGVMRVPANPIGGAA